MKKLLPLFACLAFASPCLGQTVSTTYIIVTTETKWADGTLDVVGEVEESLGETAAGYVISSEGRNYTLPKTNARVITADEAAKRLLSQRVQLYADIEKLENTLAPKGGQPTQYNGRPLPPN